MSVAVSMHFDFILEKHFSNYMKNTFLVNIAIGFHFC